MVEVVFALLLIVDHEIKEHLHMDTLSKCLKAKRLSMRSTNNAEFRCMKVKAVVKDGKIISISNLD